MRVSPALAVSPEQRVQGRGQRRELLQRVLRRHVAKLRPHDDLEVEGVQAPAFGIHRLCPVNVSDLPLDPLECPRKQTPRTLCRYLGGCQGRS